MKKILTTLALLFSFTVSAGEVVTILYSWSPGDNMATSARVLAEEANKIQNKYFFIFDTKQGAGGAVAASYVQNHPDTILSTSSAFFIRPIFYPNENYEVEKFQEILPQCDTPVGVASVKFNSWKEIPKDRPVTVGISGLGGTIHLIALQLLKKYPNIQIVPFKSTNESLLALVGGQIDLHVGFYGEESQWLNDSKNKLTILGVTGPKPIQNTSTLVSQGFPTVLAETSVPHHLVVPKTTSPEKFQEWRNILAQAAHSKAVQDSYFIDYSQSLDQIPDNKIQIWFENQKSKWKKLASTVQLEK